MIARRGFLAAVLGAVAVTGPAGAVEPDERLADPALEARARAISAELRCVVCPNQSIDDSNAGMARDLRLLVRERLAAGDSDPAVIAYVVDRYGDFVRLRPPVAPHTYALWFSPAVLAVLGGIAVALILARRRADRPAPDPLTADERRRVDALLAERARDRSAGDRSADEGS